MEQVFQCLLDSQFYLKLSKYLFAQRQLKYLGHIIFAASVQHDPSKIQVVLTWPPPANVKALRSFLGRTAFYRKFVKGYATIVSPLTILLENDAFAWTPKAQHAFTTLKQVMTRAPVLALSDFSIPFIVDMDASRTFMGVVLMQRNQLVAFFSKPFSLKLLLSSTMLGNYMPLLRSLRNDANTFWDTHLLSILIIRASKRFCPKLSRLRNSNITSLSFWGTSTRSVTSQTLITLLRMASLEARMFPLVYFMSFPCLISFFMDQLGQLVTVSSTYNMLLLRIQTDPAALPDYKLHNGLILYKNHLWLDSGNNFRLKLIDEFHNTPIGGHMGITKTVTRLLANFYLGGLCNDVKIFIQHCSICQQVKTDTHKLVGLLQPLLVPTTVWEDLSLDFITSLPSSQGFTVILVIIDRFSKGVHL